MKMNIDIDTKTFIRFWLVVIGFGLVALAIFKAWPAIVILGVAFFLAIALSPPVSRIVKILPSKSRLLSTAIAYFVVLLILGLVIFLVVPPVVEQTSKFIRTIPSLIDSAVNQYSGIKTFLGHYNLQPQFDEVVNSLKSGTTQFASGVGTNLIAGIGSIVSVIGTSIMVLVLAFLMLVEGPGWMSRVWRAYKNQNLMESHRSILAKMYNVTTSYISGQLTVSTIAGLVSGLSVSILSLFFNIPINLAIPAAAIIFVLSLIPLFGEITGALIVGLILSLNNITAGVIFLVFFLLYTQFEGNFIIPKIQSKRINLSALAVLVSVTVGIYMFGILGAIISIPVAGCIRVLTIEYLARSKNRSTTDKKTEQ